ncbi:MAG: DUF2911 domain-containing protein [Sphingobacteriales bacterium]|nr:DUF2911 domain-containing protein [Sphingobacteriales bacterium]
MKKIAVSLLILSAIISIKVNGQSSFPALDKSPMDMFYYPTAYPFLKVQEKVKEPLTARVIYSRPQKKERVIFGGLVAYGKVWRLGANEATEIDFFRPVKINGKAVAAGRYTMYCIPDTNKWTIIINKDTDTWGSFSYDIKKDIVRVELPVEKQTVLNESLIMVFEKAKKGANLIMAWDDVEVKLPIVF